MRGCWFVFVAICISLFGCGPAASPKAKLYPVKGRVTLNGKPLKGCTLSLVTIKAAPGADDVYIGKLNDEGQFELASISGKAGAAVGKYRVTLSHNAAMDTTTMTPDQIMQATKDGTLRKLQQQAQLPFPKEFLTFATSKKDVEITAESNELLIAL